VLPMDGQRERKKTREAVSRIVHACLQQLGLSDYEIADALDIAGDFERVANARETGEIQPARADELLQRLAADQAVIFKRGLRLLRGKWADRGVDAKALREMYAQRGMSAYMLGLLDQLDDE
jgi:hypothetical protein